MSLGKIITGIVAAATFMGAGVGGYHLYLKSNPEVAVSMAVDTYASKAEDDGLSEKDKTVLNEVSHGINGAKRAEYTAEERLNYAISDLEKVSENLVTAANEAGVTTKEGYIGPADAQCKVTYGSEGLELGLKVDNESTPLALRKTDAGKFVVGDNSYLNNAYKEDNADAFNKKFEGYMNSQQDKISGMFEAIEK